MKNFSFTGVAMILLMLTAGCSDDNLNQEIHEGYGDSHKVYQRSQNLTANTFAGPLFDLAIAPNNDILVADASAGIIDLYGNVEAVLPGVTSVDLVGRNNMWATTGPLGEPTEDSGQGLYRVFKNRTELIVNLFTFEEENNPDGSIIDSNPYSVLALNANEALVVDSGGNDLLRVDNKGNVEVVAVFPVELVPTENIQNLAGCADSEVDFCLLDDEIPTESVPTAVVRGPDGYFYVGELKGFPAPVGASNIWRISPNASEAMCGSSPDCVKAFDGGFTSIIDMAFDKKGTLYVAEMDVNGWFAVEAFDMVAGGVIKACDPITLNCEIVASGIPMLTAITIDKKGKLWATSNSLEPDEAQVVEIPL